MIDDDPSIDVAEGFVGQTATFFFLVDPGGKSLFDDPVSGALQAFRHQINLFGELHGHVSGDGSGFRGACREGLLLIVTSS